MRKFNYFLITGALFALFSSSVNAAAVANYQFNDPLASDIAGANDLVDQAIGSPGFYLTDTVFGQQCRVFEFDDPSGFSLDTQGLLAATEYTFVSVFYFEDDVNYQRILDFKDQASDDGFYTRKGFLTYYISEDLNGSQPVTAFQYMLVAFTRRADGTITAYKNGVESFSVNDQGTAIISIDSLFIFLDDSGEDPAGRVANMQFYDTAISAQQIAGLDMSCTGSLAGSAFVPEVGIPANQPIALSVMILLLAAFGGALIWRTKSPR